MSNLLFTVAVLAFVLGVLVFVHELGHYWAAKAFGIWVHRFSIGMGKPVKALSFHRGETEWAISWLPLGGYVKMASREEDPASSVLEGGTAAGVPADRVFEAKPIWQRMIVILAGVTLNVIFAWVVFSGLAWKNGRQFDPTTTIGAVDASKLPAAASALADLPAGTRVVTIDGAPIGTWDDLTSAIVSGNEDQITFGFEGQPEIVVPMHRDALVERSNLVGALAPMHPAVIGALSVGYPAEVAGLQVGDSVVAVAGTPVGQWTDVVGKVRASAGQPVAISVLRNGAPLTITVTPREEHDVVADTTTPLIGRVGAAARTPYRFVNLSLPEAMVDGANASLLAGTSIYRTLRGLANGQVSHKEVGGPILIGQMAAREARQGWQNLLAFMGLISMNLAVVNLLPIPVLDGGAFILLAIEGMIRRPLPTKLREIVSMFGLALIVLLMFVAFKNDIWRLLGW